MILSDRTILEFITQKKLIVRPFESSSIQPASLDCRLGNEFLMIEDDDTIKLDKQVKYKSHKAEKLTIEPKTFILATTEEYLEIPDDLTAFVEGRSSIGRIGLFIQNAGWVDAGFKGTITLELYNANTVPIELERGRRICQMVFCKMDQKAKHPYQGKYLGQKGTMGSLIYQDNEVKC